MLSATTLMPFSAHASCGAAFCALNTTWDAQGVPSDPGLRLDLRFEYIDQDQPRAGRRDVSVGEIPQHHDEVRTLNRNFVATLDYAPGADWGVAVTLPFARRAHTHVHNHHGAQISESWNYEQIGDARVVARRKLSDRDTTHGLLAGVKVPTGETSVTNAAGASAERSLQPGSGTTDLVLGYYAHALDMFGDTPVRYFAQAQLQAPIAEARGYRPGQSYSVDLGAAYPASGSWNGLLQANLLVRERERGREGEPANSGGSFLWLSPGVGFTAGPSTQVYAFVQVPMYQRVTGVQLVADRSYALGMNVRF